MRGISPRIIAGTLEQAPRLLRSTVGLFQRRRPITSVGSATAARSYVGAAGATATVFTGGATCTGATGGAGGSQARGPARTRATPIQRGEVRMAAGYRSQ